MAPHELLPDVPHHSSGRGGERPDCRTQDPLSCGTQGPRKRCCATELSVACRDDKATACWSEGREPQHNATQLVLVLALPWIGRHHAGNIDESSRTVVSFRPPPPSPSQWGWSAACATLQRIPRRGSFRAALAPCSFDHRSHTRERSRTCPSSLFCSFSCTDRPRAMGKRTSGLTSIFFSSTGNNYAIANESRTRAAKIFFAQGCVVDGDVQ